MPEEGPDSITVPGAVSGWAALHAEGATLPWAEAFGPAIALAHGGVAVSRSLSRALTERGRSWPPTPAWWTCSSTTAPRSRAAPCSGSRRSARRSRDSRAEVRSPCTAVRSASDTPRVSGRRDAHHGRRPGRAPSGRRSAAERSVPGPRRPRRPAEQPGLHAAGDARADRTDGDRPGPARSGCRHARPRLRGREPRPGSSSGRPRRDARASVHAARRRAPRGPGGPHPRRGPVHGGARPSSRLGRHDRHGDRRCRRLGGLAHPEPVGQLRLRDLGTRDRDRGPRPRRVFHAGARSSERDRAAASGRSTR